MDINNLTLKVNEGEGELKDFNYENFKYCDIESICLVCDDIIIGDALLFEDSSDNSIYLESLDIEENYRRLGYGSLFLSMLKNTFKEWGFININGECRGDLISFYKSVGGKVENRCEEDYTYISNRFYIDLN